jgi:hypothetical protein
VNYEQRKTSSSRSAASDRCTTTGVINDYPISSVLILFGAGLGAGVALVSLMSGPANSRPILGPRAEFAAEQVGRQLLSALAGVLPESLAKHIAA